MSDPFFSIITVCKNSEKNIQTCLDSIYNQSINDYEHIIQDGFSSDKTLLIIKKNKINNTKVFTQKDKGIYDALNKAILKCKGEYFIILHSDDRLYDDQVLEKLKKKIIHNNYPLIIMNNIVYVNSKGNIIRNWECEIPTTKKIKMGWMAPHTGLVLNKEVVNNIKPYDINFKISSDYGYELELCKSYIKKFKHFDLTLVKMQTGGISNKSLKSIFIKIFEDIIFMRKNNINPFIGLFFKNFRKLNQFWK